MVGTKLGTVGAGFPLQKFPSKAGTARQLAGSFADGGPSMKKAISITFARV